MSAKPTIATQPNKVPFRLGHKTIGQNKYGVIMRIDHDCGLTEACKYCKYWIHTRGVQIK